MTDTTAAQDAPQPTLGLWLRWVAANAGGELVGLGGSALTLVAFFALSDRSTPVPDIIIRAGLAVLLGTFFEGVVVGLAQWLVLREPLQGLRWQSWVSATAIGAGVAWFFGMIPSTVIAISAAVAPATAEVTPTEPDQQAVLLAAAVMGFLLGPVLGLPQYLELKRYVERAGWWVLANALAWAPGMVIVFLGAGAVPEGPVTGTTVAILIAATLAAGAVVGAINGAFLLRLLRTPRQLTRGGYR